MCGAESRKDWESGHTLGGGRPERGQGKIPKEAAVGSSRNSLGWSLAQGTGPELAPERQVGVPVYV